MVGYGTQQKNKVTGAISTISGDEIRKMQVTNNTLGLAGRVPGLISLNASGRPGSGATISIRGVSSFNNAPPLFVIDGTIRNADNFAQLDPNEIESVSVLKDAGSAAVYGVRATNGVIVVTTKRGKVGKPVFSLSSSLSFDRPTRFPNVMNAYEYAYFHNEARVNMSAAPTFTTQQVEDFRTGATPSTDWQNVAYGDHALTQQYNFSVNGGSESIQYFFNFGYTNQNGLYDNVGYTRYNFRSNIDARINKTLSAAVNLEGRVTKNKAPNISDYGLWFLGSSMLPTAPAYYPDGLPRYDLSAATHAGEVTRGSGYNNSDDNLFIGQVTLTQQLPFVRGLSAKGSIQLWRQYSFAKTFNKQYPTYIEDDQGNITEVKLLGTKTTVAESFSRGNSYTLNLSLDYGRSFGRHSVKGLILYEQYEASFDNFNGSRTNYLFSSVDQIFAGSNDDERIIDGSGGQDGRLGIVGRINYDYDSKYLVEASFRNDASYRFAPDQRWGFFPSVSAGWFISKEKFAASWKHLDQLKLRASYGILGNDIVGGFQWKSSYNVSGDYYFAENPVKYLVPSAIPNPQLTWEKTASANIGLDGSLFGRLFGFSIDIFQKNTYDVYATRTNQYPGVFGATLPAVNYGKVDVRGFELVLSHENTVNFVKYSISGNVSFARNRVRQIDYAESIEPWYNPIGKPLNYRVGWIANGLFQSDEEAAAAPRVPGTNPRAGDIRYEDLNKDGVIDSRDNSILSWYSSTPEIMYGLTMDASWKGFDISIFFQGVSNRNILLNGYSRNALLNGNSYKYFLDRWTPGNPGARYPRAWIGRNPVNDQVSSFWLTKGNFLRLKNIQLAYTIPRGIVNRAGLSNVRLYVSGFNLLVFSKIKDFDPEYPGGDGFYYPQNKSLVIGANISF